MRQALLHNYRNWAMCMSTMRLAVPIARMPLLRVLPIILSIVLRVC